MGGYIDRLGCVNADVRVVKRNREPLRGKFAQADAYVIGGVHAERSGNHPYWAGPRLNENPIV